MPAIVLASGSDAAGDEVAEPCAWGSYASPSSPADSPRVLAWVVPAAVVGGYVLWPVLSVRLGGFQSASGLPQSWLGRLNDLETYFWPRLFSDWNFVLGVEPSAVIARVSYSGNVVWIESGYTWLLWGGGIPLLASFLFFTYVAAKRGWQAAWRRADARSVAGIAVFVAVIVIAVLMVFDPHLTYRGSGDEFFSLIALVVPRYWRHGLTAWQPTTHQLTMPQPTMPPLITR